MPTDSAESLPRCRELEKLRKMVKKSKYNKRNILFEGAVHASTSPNLPWIVWMLTDSAESLPRKNYKKWHIGTPHCTERFDSRNSHTVLNDSDSMNT
jgi:hypothetical protein